MTFPKEVFHLPKVMKNSEGNVINPLMCGVRSDSGGWSTSADVIRRDDVAEDAAIAEYSATSFDGMVSCGITRRFPISLHRLFLRATNLRKPLKPACTIPCVCALHEHSAHTCCKLLKKVKNTNLFQWVAKVYKFQRVQVPYTRD